MTSISLPPFFMFKDRPRCLATATMHPTPIDLQGTHSHKEEPDAEPAGPRRELILAAMHALQQDQRRRCMAVTTEEPIGM